MKLFSKNILALIVIFTFVLASASFVFADSVDSKSQIDFVKASIQEEYVRNHPVIDVMKSDLGLDETESFNTSVLGDGVPLYIISREIVETYKEGVNPLEFYGYFFPIKVGGKHVATITVEEKEGKWYISNTSSDNSFEKEILDAKNTITGDAPTKIIYNLEFGLFAVAIQNGPSYDVVTIRGRTLNLEKHSKIPLSEVVNKINQVVKQNKEQNANSPMRKVGGAGIAPEASKENTYLNYMIGGIALLLVLAMGTVLIRKRKLGVKVIDEEEFRKKIE